MHILYNSSRESKKCSSQSLYARSQHFKKSEGWAMWERKATRVILSYVVPKAQLFLFSSSQLEEFVYMEMKRKRTLFFLNQMLFPLDLQNNKTVWPNWKSFRLSCETLLFRLFPTSYYWFEVAGIQLFCFIFRRVIRLFFEWQEWKAVEAVGRYI